MHGPALFRNQNGRGGPGVLPLENLAAEKKFLDKAVPKLFSIAAASAEEDYGNKPGRTANSLSLFPCISHGAGSH